MSIRGKVYFAECGLQNAEFRKGVFCGIKNAENIFIVELCHRFGERESRPFHEEPETLLYFN